MDIITPGANAEIGVPGAPETCVRTNSERKRPSPVDTLLSFVRVGLRQSNDYKSSPSVTFE
jgi:hypothetical protein